MSILTKFIKKKKRGGKEIERKSEKKVKEQKKLIKEQKKERPGRGKYIDASILIKPRITEKAVDSQDKGEYIFEVAKNSNKIHIKEVVGNFYNVKVKNVRIINVKRKKRRLGMIQGFKPGYKKAIVILEKGEKIEVLPR